MKARKMAMALTAVILLPGCLVSSLHPLFTEADLVFEPALLGTWRAAEKKVTFERTDQKSYRITYVELGRSGDGSPAPPNPSVLEGRLGRLGPSLFLDTFVTEKLPLPGALGLHLVPVHLFWRLRMDGDNLFIERFAPAWCKDAAPPAGIPIRLECVENDWPLLTAPTPDLQAFLTQHAADPGLFDPFGPGPFQREK